MEKKSFPISVVMERIAVNSRWQTEKWQLAGVLPDDRAATGSRILIERDGLLQKIHAGYSLVLYPDEGEGYYLNITSPEPRVFATWRMNEDESEAIPHMVTLSYNEAARWMDAQEHVDSVAIPEDIFSELVGWVEANYQPPEKKQRIRPKSFESKDGRYKGGMS
ncbi:MAG: DUF3305 domain-containing protein [Betaproteobacteria bacterium]